MTDTVERRAHAKVNLALHVVGRRSDGYHRLDSIAVFADCADRIVLQPADALALDVTGPFAAHAPGGSKDLAWRAAEAFFKHIDSAPAVSIRVEKTIPAGAGLGGGSADAAAVLAGLNALTGAELAPADLARIGLTLGADVPMCLAGQALRARGVGEEISRLQDWPLLPLVLVWPGRAVSTAEVFAALSSRENPPLPEPPTAPTVAEAADYLARCRNDLEAPAIQAAPEIGDVLAALRSTDRCLVAHMSGSGSACFGLYASVADAGVAATRIRSAQRSWWFTVTTVR